MCSKTMEWFVLTLFFIAARAQVNPFCPISDRITTCEFIPGVHCISDDECELRSRGKICCPDGCSSLCKDPIKPIVKEGTCPVPPPLAATSCLAPVTDSCQKDFECKGRDKCCEHPCGKRCETPVAEVCVVEGKAYKVGETFQIDCNTCTCEAPGHSSCTEIGCIPKPGSCPLPPTGIYCFWYNIQCTGDGTCPRDEKCCGGPCGRACTKPVRAKPGVCSSLPPGLVPVCNPNVPPQIQCNGDGDCDDNDKCCPGVCGNIDCSKPDKPGSCAKQRRRFPFWCRRRRDFCDGDFDCPRNLKCCDASCGRRCQRPRRVRSCGVPCRRSADCNSGPRPNFPGCGSCKCSRGGDVVSCPRPFRCKRGCKRTRTGGCWTCSC